MSYRNPKYTYISDAPELQRMQQSLTSSVVAAGKEKKAEEATEKAQKKTDRLNQVAWNDNLLSANTGGDYEGGILDKTYAGSGKRYAELQRMIENGGCEDEDCTAEAKELSVLKEGPKETMKFLGNFNMDLDSLKNKNVDTTQPLYANMEAAQNIISGAMGYGKPDYDVEIIKNDNGTQNMIFKGEEFGPEGWNINSAQLDKIVNADPPGSLLAPATDWKQEKQDLTEMSGVFDPDTIDANGDFTSLNPDMLSNVMNYEFDETQTAAFNKAKEANPELTQEEYAQDNEIEGNVVEGVDGKPLRKIKWVRGTRVSGNPPMEYTIETPTYEYDEEAMYAKIGVVADAEMKAAFGINEQGGVDNQGPNEAFNMFNSPEPGLFKNIPEEFKNDPKMKELFTADGKLNWDALDTGKCKEGSACSAYTTEGTIKPELLKGVRDVYVKNYMDSDMRKHLDKKTTIPADELENYPEFASGEERDQLHGGIRYLGPAKTVAQAVFSNKNAQNNAVTQADIVASNTTQSDADDEDLIVS